MAALSPLTVPCPSCGSDITIPLSATSGERREAGTLTMAVSLDPEPIREHVEQHRSRKWLLLEVARRYAIPYSHLAEVPDCLLRHMLSFRPRADEGEA